MSLKEAFARNRAVFERLTATDADSDEPQPSHKAWGIPEWERPEADSDGISRFSVTGSASDNIPRFSVVEPAFGGIPRYSGSDEKANPAQRFSLSRSYDTSTAKTVGAEFGSISRETGMALDIHSIGENEYPPLRDIEPRAADPLEALYHQLEVEARMSSQISCEEDF